MRWRVFVRLGLRVGVVGKVVGGEDGDAGLEMDMDVLWEEGRVVVVMVVDMVMYVKWLYLVWVVICTNEGSLSRWMGVVARRECYAEVPSKLTNQGTGRVYSGCMYLGTFTSYRIK